ncbi:MAG: universal stress protein [Thermoanaerobaculia bacterium]
MSETPRKMIIGTSLTAASDDVVRIGAAIARAAGASPWLVHGYLPAALPLEAAVDGILIEQQIKELHEALAQQAQRTGLADLPGFKADRLLPLMDSPSRAIVELARQARADLIVIGAAESGALHRLLLGSTAGGVVRKTPCPVLVLRSASAFPPARVEIPVDFSPISAHALSQGLSLLAEVGVPLADTEVLFVLSPFEAAGSLHFTAEQVEHFAGEELGRFAKANSPGAVPRLARVRVGVVTDEILAVLQERQADLAILGTHGRSGFERLTLGSVAADVMHRGACNLLVVPPDASLQQETAHRREELKRADWTFVSDETPATAGTVVT